MIRIPSVLAVPALVAICSVAPSAVTAADFWQIDSVHSAAQFSVTHLMIATVRGEFGSMSGKIEFDGHDVSSIKADITINAATITTRNEKRDGHLKSADFFDVAKYPAITFVSKKIVPGTGGTFKLVGDLTMHGVTKEVSLDVTGPSPIVKGTHGDSRVAASATTKLNRQDFGVKWNNTLEGGGVVVSDTVAITIDIEAMRHSSEAPPPAKK